DRGQQFAEQSAHKPMPEDEGTTLAYGNILAQMAEGWRVLGCVHLGLDVSIIRRYVNRCLITRSHPWS
ncbi:MAG: hypothetical protein KJ063_19325, partial [Anaerolineae bacterium]|nr:hypothetical protein [Anaerolineae bacterium]